MGMDLASVKKANWELLKKNAGIKSAKWYEKAHADVGGHIDKFQKARKKYKDAQTTMNLKEYNSALESLDKAFGKFLGTKEFKTDLAADLQGKILAWRLEVQTKSAKLKQIYEGHKDDLDQNGADNMKGILGGAGLWDEK